jgi:hypothetical protein
MMTGYAGLAARVLTLALFVFLGRANNPYYAFAADDLTFFADFLYR